MLEAPAVDFSSDQLEAVLEDGEFVLYRIGGAANTIPARSALVVMPRSEHPRPQAIRMLENEHSRRNELDPAWAIRSLALTTREGRAALVLEDPGGEVLARRAGTPMDVGEALRIGAGLATALRQLHVRGLIHKDIKPANVMTDGTTGQVWLRGFGIASRLPRERRLPEPPEFIAGTLPYMAPEQTGWMNRSIDARSDLYALGVVLYELLTGRLPFTAADPMAWVHAHIAGRPVPPAERRQDIPDVVSAIVMKLLAKTAEDRYQTAAAVERDLRRCLAQSDAERRIDAFALAEDDTPDRLVIPEKLYGRAREIDTLLGAFERVVASGTPELVLVSGYSGIGKSSVVNELHKVLVPPRGLFGSGKFDQYKRDIPYSTLAQAFQILVRYLLGKSDAELSGWRDALVEALGPNGPLMIDLVPELELIIGDQPPVPELAPQDARGRFQVVFRRFIGVFARPEHPLALFLDDLQWLDAATFDLLEDLLTPPGVPHLMLIGAYRDNEVTAAHLLMRKLEAIRSAGANVQEITLAPLAAEDVAQLVADALRCDSERAAPLAQLVWEKTAGNPFFLVQFLQTLAEEGWLAFDHEKARWSWDLNRIHAKRYRDNVVDLMVGRLNRLPLDTQKALAQLACLGIIAPVRMLSFILGKSPEEVGADLWEAVRLELVEPLEGSYQFVHDRVQEAAYSLIPEEERDEAHLRIGRRLAAHIPPEEREEAIFDIVNQFNRGASLITSRDEREQVAEFNLLAGKRAKASAAYASALMYLVAGAELLPADSWERQHAMCFELELHRAECEFLTGALAVSEERLKLLSARAANTVERARVASLRVNVYTTLDQSERAVEVCLEYLAHLGVEWPPHPAHEQALDEYQRVWSRLGARRIEDLSDLPLMSDPAMLATLDVLNDVVPPALFTDRNLLSLVICRMVNLSLEHGNSDASCFAYVFLGMIAGPHFDNYAGGFQFGRLGYELTEKRGLHRYQARTYMAFGNFVMPWTKHVRTGRDLVRRAFDIANKAGDLTFAAYSCNNLNTNLLAAGDALAGTQLEAERGLEFAQKARFGLVIEIITAQLQLIRTLRGLTPTFGSLDGEQFDESRFEGHLASQRNLALPECWYWIRKLQARVLAEDYRSAVDAASKAQPLLWTSPSFFETAEYEFYGGLARAGLCHSIPSEEQPQHRAVLSAHYRQLEIWATHCPENFESRAALVGGEIARIDGRIVDAEQLYEQAIRSAHEHGFVQNEGLAYESAARFYAARGFDEIAHLYLRRGRRCYARWGADGKVRQLDERHPRLREEEPAPDARTTIGEPVERLELATVLRISQAVLGEIELEKLVDTVLRTAIEHAGADRGVLIAPQGDELRIQAEGRMAGGAIGVRVREMPISSATVPESVVRYAARAQESVNLDDASTRGGFENDDYVRREHARSVLCLPLLQQGQLMALLYLENNLAAGVFTPARMAVLNLLASQASMALEKTRLYRELQQREARIRRLVDANIVGIIVWDLEGRILEANDAFLSMVGYDRRDLAAGCLNWIDLTPPEWRNHDEQVIPELTKSGPLQPFEKEYLRKDGSRVPVLVGVAASEETGNQEVAFVLDLTERRRAEQRVLAEHRATQVLAEAVTVEEAIPRVLQALCECLGWDLGAWWRPDREAGVLRCAELWRAPSLEAPEFEAATRASTFPRGRALAGRAWASRAAVCIADVLHDPTFLRAGIAAREGLHAAFAFPILLGGEVLGVIDLVSREIRQPDQELLDRMATLGSQIGQFIERKRAEQALRESERESRLIVNTIPGLVVVLTPAGEIDVVNDQLGEYCGQPLEALRQWRMNETFHSEDLPRVAEIITQGMASGEAYGYEARIRRFDGVYRWFQVRHLPLRDTRGQVARWYALLSDIDDRKRAEAELREAYSELTHVARVTTMGELTASIAHEVNQPITAAVTSAQTALRWLEAQPPELGEVRQALSRIVRAGKRAGDVIGRIRALVTKAPPRKDSVEINDVIREVVELTRGEAAKNGVSVRTDLAEGLPLIQGDRVQLQQVILNLILNGIEAMTGVGEAARELKIRSRRDDGGGVRVTVADNGPGLAAGALEQMFAAFYTTKPGGLGLGLSICRSIIEAHDGRLWASPNQPRGAVFQFTLPIPAR